MSMAGIFKLKKNKEFGYTESGEGFPIVLLHGLMGGLSNFNGVFEHLPKCGYKVLFLELPIYSLPILNTNLKSMYSHLKEFLEYKKIDKCILIGNSLGGHIALGYALSYPDKLKGIILMGSSGLYENTMSESYPKRRDYDYIKTKTEEVFYDPKMASKEMVDNIYNLVNQRSKVIRTIAMAKSAMRTNMAKHLPNINTPTLLVWGKNDSVTPPEVGEDFHKLMPNSELHFIDKCGHAPMWERPVECNAILEDWIGRILKK